MINLLPNTTRQNMLYARRNTALLKWALMLIGTIFFTAVIVASGMIYLTQTTKSYEKKAVVAKQALEAQNLEATQKEITTVSSNIKLSTDVLSREILFSKLLQQLGAALPADTSLQTLQIDNLKGGLSLSAGASNIESGTQLQVNLQDPKNQIFEKADIENISCDNEVSAEKIYPCTVQVRALFMKNNPFLYISPTTKKAATP